MHRQYAIIYLFLSQYRVPNYEREKLRVLITVKALLLGVSYFLFHKLFFYTWYSVA